MEQVQEKNGTKPREPQNTVQPARMNVTSDLLIMMIGEKEIQINMMEKALGDAAREKAELKAQVQLLTKQLQDLKKEEERPVV